MKHLDIGENGYAHLDGNKAYLYLHNEFQTVLHIDNI